MKSASPQTARVLVTGATGFVGKVVLEELLRRRAELGIASVVLIIRPKKGEHARERFALEIASSECFSRLPPGWEADCEVIEGDLFEADCGVADAGALDVTHILHCAASVEFDLPLAEAARANITSGQNVLALARRSPHLRAMVSMSTAYVTPHRFDGQPVREELVPLPFRAADVYRDILEGRADQEALLARTGHPNTYTFTKCIAEHLLLENRGQVPLVILRPSIVAACWQQPFPGWIDSYAGFAGFAAVIGMGRMKAVVGDEKVALDLVPCDEVAQRAIDCAFASEAPATPIIRHAVAGITHASRIDECIEAITGFFRDNPAGPYARVWHVGERDARFHLHDALHHRAPTLTAQAWLRLSGDHRQARRAAKLLDRIDYLNGEFPYFTRRTFAFESSLPMRLPGFSTRRYARLTCRGIARHLLGRDETRLPLAGAEHDDGRGDAQWTLLQREGNAVIRSFAYAARKTLRRASESVTFDLASFEEALAQAPENARFVIVPSHRSYLDFILCSYLFFSQSSLGVRVPHIAAAAEFSRLPLLGHLLPRAHAFYLHRGQGAADVELSQHVRSLVERRETIQFFIEGARSRSGQFLTPRRGLLRCLQSTGETFTVLPVSVSYDRVPEEAALLRELQSGVKPPMEVRKLVEWMQALALGRVSLGRIHLACGAPLTLDPESDVHALSRQIVGELQERVAPTTRHLRGFIEQTGIGIELPWLVDAIKERGGEVIEAEDEIGSPLPSAPPSSGFWMRWNFIHRFYADARHMWPGHPALEAHLRAHDYRDAARTTLSHARSDEATGHTLRVLFGPVLRDYELTVRVLGSPESPRPRYANARAVVDAIPSAYLPYVQDAFTDLAARQILREAEKGTYVWGPRSRDISHLLRERDASPPVPQRGVSAWAASA